MYLHYTMIHTAACVCVCFGLITRTCLVAGMTRLRLAPSRMERVR